MTALRRLKRVLAETGFITNSLTPQSRAAMIRGRSECAVIMMMGMNLSGLVGSERTFCTSSIPSMGAISQSTINRSGGLSRMDSQAEFPSALSDMWVHPRTPRIWRNSERMKS